MTLSIVEIIILQFFAVVLGFAIHFFISSRKEPKMSAREAEKLTRGIEDWKSKYFNDMDERDKEIDSLKEKLADAIADARDYRAEMESLVKENKAIQAELEEALNRPQPEPVIQQVPVTEKPDYISQLRIAQSSLMEHNEKINQLLSQIDVIKEKEEQQQMMIEEKDKLNHEVHELKVLLNNREKELTAIKQREQLTKDMNIILESAYAEFNVLQGKIQKLELQLNQSKLLNIEYEDLKETHYKVIRDFEDQKSKFHILGNENQELKTKLEEVTEKLRETDFQRQQLQKRVSYLEELNNDLHVVAEANNKLESQLKKVGELESRLNAVAAEGEAMLKKQSEGY